MRNPIAYLVLKGWQYAGNQRPWMLVYGLLFLCAQSISLCDPYIIGKLINSVQVDASSGNASKAQLLYDVYPYLWLYFAVKVGFWMCHGPGRVIERIVAFHIKANYKSELFSFVNQLPLQWHREHHSGESIDKINRATAALSEFFASSVDVCYAVFTLIGVEIILFRLMPVAGWFALGTTLVALGIIIIFDNVLYEQYDVLNKSENSIASAIHDYVTNVISVITLRLEKRVLLETKRRIDLPLPVVRENVSINELKWCVTTLLVALMAVIVMSWYIHESTTGQVILGGTFFMLFDYLRRIGDSFYGFASIYGSVVRKAADVYSAESLHKAFGALKKHSQKASLPADWERVSVKSLFFTYQDEKLRTHHLENVAIDLTRARTIALVGESGSGKSTLLNLLRGLQTADRVELECDGLRLQQGLSHLASSTTLMPQDPEIFADTIRFNITFGLNADEAEIMNAIRMAGFESTLMRLPYGLETNIAEKGVNLSGGEKQRLALARGLYFAKDSDIVLLDEPTSSVDAQNERTIYEDVLLNLRDKCIVSSVHKLHLLEMFDCIYVLEDGKIIESGDFYSLLNKRGLLAKMWKNYQASDLSSISRTRLLKAREIVV